MHMTYIQMDRNCGFLCCLIVKEIFGLISRVCCVALNVAGHRLDLIHAFKRRHFDNEEEKTINKQARTYAHTESM